MRETDTRHRPSVTATVARMSADNYNWVDLHPENELDKRWSVTNGFMSDEDPPRVPNGSTKWFSTFAEADWFAQRDWTEYGETYSPRVHDYLVQKSKENR